MKVINRFYVHNVSIWFLALTPLICTLLLSDLCNFQNPPTADDLNKMFENLGLLGSEDEGAMGGLFPLMQVMLENILSKEVLYPPMKEITEKVSVPLSYMLHQKCSLIRPLLMFICVPVNSWSTIMAAYISSKIVKSTM